MSVISSSEEARVGAVPSSQDPLPPVEDQWTPREAMAQFGITGYSKIASWWRRGYVPYWTVGHNVILSRSQTTAYHEHLHTPKRGAVRPRWRRSEPNNGPNAS